MCYMFSSMSFNSQNIPLKQVFPTLQVDKVAQSDQGQQVTSCGQVIFPGHINTANSIITRKRGRQTWHVIEYTQWSDQNYRNEKVTLSEH